MTAVARILACLLLAFIAIPVATADLQSLASAAHEYRNRLNNLKAADGDSLEAAATLRQLAGGSDPAAAEAQAESMVAAGYENYVLWTTLREIKSKLGKDLDAVYAAYLATEAVSSEAEKVTAFDAVDGSPPGI
jgi:alpha-2-macroglobulin